MEDQLQVQWLGSAMQTINATIDTVAPGKNF